MATKVAHGACCPTWRKRRKWNLRSSSQGNEPCNINIEPENHSVVEENSLPKRPKVNFQVPLSPHCQVSLLGKAPLEVSIGDLAGRVGSAGMYTYIHYSSALFAVRNLFCRLGCLS